MWYTLSVIGFFLLTCYLLYALRHRWVLLLPHPLSSRLRHYAPISTFDEAANQGFSTGNFDLAVNLEEGSEARQGLDEEGLLEVRRIMEINRVGFDEARRIRQERIFKKNGVDEFGFPIDPKAITRLS